MNNGAKRKAQPCTNTHTKHSHWDVAIGKEIHKTKMNIRDTQANAPTSIQMETFFKKESTVIHIHTLVLECGPRKRNTQNENEHRRHTTIRTHTQTHALGCGHWNGDTQAKALK